MIKTNENTVPLVFRPQIILFKDQPVRTIWVWLVGVAAACVCVGFIFNYPMVWFFALIALGMLNIPTLVGLSAFLTWSVIIDDSKVVCKDHSFNLFMKTSTQQEIAFRDIAYIYYLDKEYNLLKRYRKALKKYKIAPNESDYRRENLIHKYGVAEGLIYKFEEDSQKLLDDYAATGILVTIEGVLNKYEMSDAKRKSIISEFKKTDEFNIEHAKRLLTEFNISPENLKIVAEEFSNCEEKYFEPFLITRLKMGTRFNNTENAINTTLIMSNEDGTSKVYLKKYHLLSRADWQRIIHIVNQHKPDVTYLMTKQDYKNLADPNFKPGCC
jgi:hypothetical protein